MTSVYRVQDKHGRGPFKPGFTNKWLEHDKGLAPFFTEFPLLNLNAESTPDEFVGCACLELEQLKRWFTQSEFKTLEAKGFKAVKMDVDRVLCSSKNQCVFARKRQLRKGVVEVSLYDLA